MGRPIKKGLMFFYNDVDFYQDIRIRKLIRRRGGQAATVYHILLCEIYRQGYYLPYDDDVPFLILEISGFDEKYISDVIRYCIEVGLFDRQLFDSDHVLTSHGIQQRYFAAGKDARRKTGTDLPYLLVDAGRCSRRASGAEEGDLFPSVESGVSSEETAVNAEETRVNAEETRDSSEKSTQRKEKERKDNNSLRSSLSPSTTPTPACVCEEVRDGDAGEDVPMTAREGIEVLKGDRDWLLQMQRKFSLESGMIIRWLDSFVVDCDCRGKQDHEGLSDVKQHFNDWMTKQKPVKSSGKSSVGQDSLSPRQRWIRCQAELCQSVSADVSARSFDTVRFESYNAATGELFIQVPAKETYEYMEQELVQTMSRIIPKYFGAGFKLRYRLPK